MVESGPMLTVKVPVVVVPPVEVNSTEKVVSPCALEERVFTGSTVKVQLWAPEPRVTVILLVSTPVALAQPTVYWESSVMWSKALIAKVRLRPTLRSVGAVKTRVDADPTLTVIVGERTSPLVILKFKVKVALPCVLPEVMIYRQPLRMTVILLSTLVGSKQK